MKISAQSKSSLRQGSETGPGDLGEQNLSPLQVDRRPRAIATSHPNKAAEKHELTLRILHIALNRIAALQASLYNACPNQGYCPKHFRPSMTVVLRKPGPADYIQPQSYRPIALLSTKGRRLKRSSLRGSVTYQ